MLVGLILEGLRRDREKKRMKFGTDASGIATPSGSFPDQPFRPVPLHEEEDKEEGTPDIICPECGSKDVNVHNNGDSYFCVDCGYAWTVLDADADGVPDEDEKPEDVKIEKKKKQSKEPEKEPEAEKEEDANQVQEEWNDSGEVKELSKKSRKMIDARRSSK